MTARRPRCILALLVSAVSVAAAWPASALPAASPWGWPVTTAILVGWIGGLATAVVIGWD